jgi:molybdate transport system substrate-binding protein
MGTARIFRCLVLVVCLCSCVPRPHAAQITVFAAASLTESLREIALDYEKKTNDKLVLNFGASSTLARQIEEGAPADVFFSADEAQMNQLEGKGLVVVGSRQQRLSNMLVIIVAAKDGAQIQTPADLAREGIKRIALGDAKAVPVGVYARKYLETKGLWKAISPKVIPTENARGALAAVEAGNADASIVYRTDALISKKVVVAYTVPVHDGPKIRYPVALVWGAREPNGSRRFLAYLASEPASQVFEKHGFVVMRDPGPREGEGL